jgi:hypothetical protein
MKVVYEGIVLARATALSVIVFNGQPDNVTWVFVAGKLLKKNGQLVGVDLKKVLRDAQAAVRDIEPAIQP